MSFGVLLLDLINELTAFESKFESKYSNGVEKYIFRDILISSSDDETTIKNSKHLLKLKTNDKEITLHFNNKSWDIVSNKYSRDISEIYGIIDVLKQFYLEYFSNRHEITEIKKDHSYDFIDENVPSIYTEYWINLLIKLLGNDKKIEMLEITQFNDLESYDEFVSILLRYNNKFLCVGESGSHPFIIADNFAYGNSDGSGPGIKISENKKDLLIELLSKFHSFSKNNHH